MLLCSPRLQMATLFAACSLPVFVVSGFSARAEVSNASLPRYVFLEDCSQSVAYYTARGLPDLDRLWSEQDWKTVVRALTKIAREDPAALPRWQSPRSGVLFARLLAEVDRDPPAVSLSSPMYDSPFHRYYRLDRRNWVAINLFEIYFVRGRKRLPSTGDLAPTLDRELAEITAAKLGLLTEALESLDAVEQKWVDAANSATGPRADRIAVRREDFRERRQHWERYTAAMGNTFTNQTRFRDPARRRLAAAWKAAVLANVSRFSPEGRQRLVNSATPGLRAETSPEVRRLLAAALAHPVLSRMKVQER